MAKNDDIPEGWSTVQPEASDVPEGWKPVVSTGEDIKRSAKAGLAEGTAGLAGAPGDVQKALAGSGLDEWLTQKAHGLNRRITSSLGLPEDFFAGKKGGYSLARPEVGEIRLPTTEEVKDKTGLKAFDWDPQSEWGRYTKAGASFVPGAVTGGAGNVIANVTRAGVRGAIPGAVRSLPGLGADIARFGIAPGVAQEYVGSSDLVKGTPFEAPARIATGALAGHLTGKFISPGASTAPELTRQNYAGQVERMRQEGMPLSAGEVTNSNPLRYHESQTNPAMLDERGEALTAAATRRVGRGHGMETHETGIISREPGDNTIDNILRETGGRFDALQGRNTLHPDAAMGHDIVNLQQHYTNIPGAYTPEAQNALTGAATHLTGLLQANGPHALTNGTFLTGEQYQRLASQLRTAARTSGNPQTAMVLHDFVNTLDNAMERSIARPALQGGNPNDVGLFPKARRDYKNALVIEDAAKASNAAGAAGYITPAKLEAAANKIYGSRTHTRGDDPFDFAPAAKSVYKIMPDSGTSHRSGFEGNIDTVAHGIGALAGALGGGLHGGGGVEQAVLGAILGETTGAAALKPFIRGAYSKYLDSPVGRLHLGNQLLAGQPGMVHGATQHFPEHVFPAAGRAPAFVSRPRHETDVSIPGLLSAIQAIQQTGHQ